jgi:ribokinase
MISTNRIFLSSTYSDLVPYRTAVENLVRKFGELFIGMEHFGARSQPSLETCLQEVRGSDVVLVLAGARYGTLSDARISFTQHEVEEARGVGIPVLVFLQEHPESVSKAEAIRQRTFVRWLKQHYTCARFEDPVSLVTQVAAGLRRLELRSNLAGDSTAWRELGERAAAPADWDCITLAAHNVDHLYPVDRVAADYETRIRAPIVTAGGSGANTVAGLGRMGLRVAAAGSVGADKGGEFLRAELEADGVTPLLAPLRTPRRPTGRTIAFTDNLGRRSIYVEPGANERFAAASRPGSYLGNLRAAIGSARVVHYSSFTLAPERNLQEKLLGDLPQQGILSLTPGALYCKLGLDRMAPLLRRTNILFVYEQQLDALLGQNSTRDPDERSLDEKIERLYEWKRKNHYHEPLAVVIKNAPNSTSTTPQQLRGVVGRTEIEMSQPTQASIAPTVDVRDSTGAGDASATGLLWAILQMEPFNYALDISYVFARSACSEYGGRAGLPTVAQVKRRWRTWVGSPHRLSC